MFFIKDYSNFVHYFGSKNLTIEDVLQFNPHRLMPHDLYPRLIKLRDQHARELVNEKKIDLCERNLEKLAVACDIEHERLNINKPNRLMRLISRVFSTHHQDREPRLEVPQAYHQAAIEHKIEDSKGKEEDIEEIDAIGQKPMEEIDCFIIQFCCQILSVQQINQLQPLEWKEKMKGEPEECSPHSRYEQLLALRDTYGPSLAKEQLEICEENLKTLAFVCVMKHVPLAIG